MRKILVALLSVSGLLALVPASARELTLENRVAAQRAIEQVYWNHRIWPKENPQAKPPLSAGSAVVARQPAGACTVTRAGRSRSESTYRNRHAPFQKPWLSSRWAVRTVSW